MSNPPRRATKVRKAKVVIFDEENLARTLHPPNKTYGFMEIDEPKTPHPSKGQPVSSKELRKKLEKLKDLEEVSSLSLVPNAATGEDAASHHREQRRREFEERRKKSYTGEFLKAKEALKKLKDEEEPEPAQKKT